jgi:hypothetical protein
MRTERQRDRQRETERDKERRLIEERERGEEGVKYTT